MNERRTDKLLLGAFGLVVLLIGVTFGIGFEQLRATWTGEPVVPPLTLERDAPQQEGDVVIEPTLPGEEPAVEAAPPEEAEPEAVAHDDQDTVEEQDPRTAFDGPAPGTLLEVLTVNTTAADQVRRLGPPLFEHFGVPDARYAVDAYRVRFISSDFDGTPAEITAQLFVPRLEEPAELPLYVFGSGTTGIADVCAPSLEQPEVRRWGHYRTNMLAYAAKGFIVMFPDYLGFHDPERPQRYFSKRAEGHTMLDAIRATYNFFDDFDVAARPSGDVFTAGYSQGGHAALAAADLRPEYAPEIPLTGVIAYGTTNDVKTLLQEGPYYAPYIFYNYADMYGHEEINPAAFLQQRWVETLSTDVNRLCVDQFQQYYPFEGRNLYRQDFYEALYGGRLAEDFPNLYRRLAENRSGLSGHGLPTLIIQGNEDIIVTTPSQTRYVQALCEAGSAVEFHTMDGVRHRHTRPAGFAPTVEFMNRLTAGEEPISHCHSL